MTSLQFQLVGFLNLIKPFCSRCFSRKNIGRYPKRSIKIGHVTIHPLCCFLFGDFVGKNKENNGIHDMFITNDLNH